VSEVPAGGSLTAVPRHVAVIPDGNRRYARKHALSYAEAYMAGAGMALELVHWCLDAGIEHLSGFGSSSDNLALRPDDEARAIRAAVDWFCAEARAIPEVELRIFGRGDERAADEGRWSPDDGTGTGANLVVHVARQYSGRDDLAAIAAAVPRHGQEAVGRAPERFLRSAHIPPIDLLLRTGGQRRLSGFLPLQSAYAELCFLDTLWAELTRAEFRGVLGWYAAQDRHFGE
jgi:short-chain Z-isoprenyl diphosphate synthase